MSNARANSAGWTDGNTTITAAQANTIDANQARSIDGAGGGNHAPSNPVSIKGQGIGDSYLTGALNAKTGSVSTYESGSIAAFLVGSFLQFSVGSDIPDDGSVINISGGQVRQHTTPVGAVRDHDLSASGNRGNWILIIRQFDGGGRVVNIHRPGAGASIVTLPDAWGFAFIYDDGVNWRLGMTSGTPGTDA